MEEDDCDAVLATNLDDIAWVTNLRGTEIEFSPLFISYAIIVKQGDKAKLTLYRGSDSSHQLGQVIIYNTYSDESLGDYFRQNNIEVKPYLQVFEDLSQFRGKIAVDQKTCNHKAYTSINEDNVVNVPSLIGKLKLIKTDTELDGYRNSQIRDATALVKFFAWLENELVNNGTKITEFEAA